MKKKIPHLLWDLRLYSTGYANRGVGTFCTILLKQIVSSLDKYKLFIWGDKNKAPSYIQNSDIQWIPYEYVSWKQDMIHIPLLIYKYKIDIFHYWVMLGPLRQCSVGLFHPCKSIGVVHDIGVEYWDVPFLKVTKSSTYWKAQKILTRSINSIITVSEATKKDCFSFYKKSSLDIGVTHLPIQNKSLPKHKREDFFITLGGSPHKNSKGVILAFEKFRKTHPDFTLLVLGTIDEADNSDRQYDGVQFELSMDNYKHYLQTAKALLFCSFFEGLGLPPLEAMEYECPIIVSDIPPLRETCSGAALFVNPSDPDEIAVAMSDIVKHTSIWIEKTREGFNVWNNKSKNCKDVLITKYESLLGHNVNIKN